MRSLTRIAAAAAVTAIAVGITACEGNDPQQSSQQRESESRINSYNQQVAAQPAHEMKYSASRDTINFFIDSWGKEGQLSYVYLVNSEGQPIGYYIIKGRPLTMCAALTPTWDWQDIPGDEDDVKQQVPAPGVDGVYYGSGGGCNTFYGEDATTGAYVEYTAGLGINVLLYNQPLPAFNGATALGPTSLDDVKG